MYVETRPVVPKSGPSAGKEKLVFDFHVGADDELVSVWETAVLRSKLARELRERRKADFEPGEHMVIAQLEKKTGPNGPYRDFDIEFQFAAPKRIAADLLNAEEDEQDGEDADYDIPFG